jgi:predicted AAA+ superfamily ATPase
MKNKLLQIAYTQKDRLINKSGLIIRDGMEQILEATQHDERVLIVTGMRRVGKSTLMHQLMTKEDHFCYFNFEDEKLLDFTIEHFSLLEEVLIEVYGPSNNWFFDEIQNVVNFEIAVRRMQDEGKRIVLTGSNSSMLSIEFGTKLTGRYKQIELFPFSFAEYLRYRDVAFSEKDFYISESKVILRGHFTTWLNEGGLPEYLLYKDPDYVRTLFDNILFRDIIVRYGIRRHRELRELVHLLASNLTLPVTFTSLQRSIGLSNSDTVKEYMGYLSNSYMFYELHQYHDSIRKQLRNPRKVFVNDIAFHNLVGFSNSQNFGRKLENAVYLHLRRQNLQIFSYNGKGECDFIILDTNRSARAIQVCYHLSPENEARELGGLAEASKAFGNCETLLLTADQELEVQNDGQSIQVLPVWKWMLK